MAIHFPGLGRAPLAAAALALGTLGACADDPDAFRDDEEGGGGSSASVVPSGNAGSGAGSTTSTTSTGAGGTSRGTGGEGGAGGLGGGSSGQGGASTSGSSASSSTSGSSSGSGSSSSSGSGGGSEPPTDFYIAPSGSNANTGTSLGSPWKTFEHALVRLKPGHTLHVRGGTYVEVVDLKSLPAGKATAPIVVKRYGSEKPVIKGHLRLQRPTYWVWDGVSVTRDPAKSDAFGDLVHLRDGKGWVFRNVEVWGGRGYANVAIAGGVQYAGEPGGFRFEYNCVHDIAVTHTSPAYQDHNVYVNFGANAGAGGVIQRNILYNAPNGSGIKIGAGKEESLDPASVSIRYNTIYNGARSIVIAHETAKTSFERNLFVKATGGVSNDKPNVTPLIYAYHLDGAGNWFRNNYGWDAGVFVHHQPPNTKLVENKGGNAFNVANPVLDLSKGCAGFQPSLAAAKAYGRYAP